jgi:hypothetical protein
VFRLLQTRDEELAHAFNDARRSTRATIESLVKEFTR